MRQSIESGDAVITHCMAGKHRAAGLAVVMRAVLAKESLADANSAVQARRYIEINKLLENKELINVYNYI